MRRRRPSRSRLAGVVVAAAFIAVLAVPEWSTRAPQVVAEATPVLAVDTVITQADVTQAGITRAGSAQAGDPVIAGDEDRLAAGGTSPPAIVPAISPAPDAEALPVLAEQPAPADTIEVKPGDTPLKLLARIGVTREDAHAAIRELSTVWDPRDLKPGQRAAVLMHSDRLLSVRLAIAPDRDVVVARDDSGGFVVEDQDRPTQQIATLAAGTIHTSLSAAAHRARVPAGVLGEMIKALSYDVDFQRDVQPGDTFVVLYQRIEDEFGRRTGLGQMVYAEMVLSGTRLRLYRFTPQGGELGYYSALGESIRKPLLRTPIDGARISSTYGMRVHPILGYSRMHRGVDFAAPSGTAIYAAGDGVVARMGRVGGYGNYVEIKHNEQFVTAYAHLSRYARGLRAGARVRQGDVIGYVGMTGTATGPHLHYEVHHKGRQVDPQSIKMPSTTRLAGNDLRAFQLYRGLVDRQVIDLREDRFAQMICRGSRC
jgi:murein DD-endopeptidase MepM/ murein hydrolase activator NlpD